MYIYDLSISMADKELIFDEKLISAIKSAIAEVNASISARRSGRVIEYIKQLTQNSIHLRLTSADPLAPTRTVSAVSRTLLRNERDLLEKHIVNSCIFSSRLISQSTSNNTDDLDPIQLVQEVVAIVLGQFADNKQRNLAKEASDQIKEVVLRYLDRKS